MNGKELVHAQNLNYIAHGGKKGMLWGFFDGKSNGKRKAGEDKVENVLNTKEGYKLSSDNIKLSLNREVAQKEAAHLKKFIAKVEADGGFPEFVDGKVLNYDKLDRVKELKPKNMGGVNGFEDFNGNFYATDKFKQAQVMASIKIAREFIIANELKRFKEKNKKLYK